MTVLRNILQDVLRPVLNPVFGAISGPVIWFYASFTGANGVSLRDVYVPEIVDGVAGTIPVLESGADTWTIQSNAAVNDPGLGTDKVVNGDFTTDSDWVKEDTVIEDGVAKVTASSLGTPLEQTTLTGVVGMIDCVSFTLSNHSLGAMRSSFGSAVGIFRTGNGIFKQFSTSVGTGSFKLLTGGTAFTAYVDNVSVEPVTLNELFATDDLSIAEGIFDINITIPTTSDGMAGLVLALDSESSPANFIQSYYNRGTGKVEVWKCVAGTYTNLINTTATYAAGAQLRVITDYISATDDLKLKVYYDGALIGTEQTIEDAGIAGNTRHGIMSTSSSNSLDDFTVTTGVPY